MTTFHQPPYQADGLYDPRYEHDACGVALVARLDNQADARGRRQGARWRSRTSSTAAPTGADARTGDGAGILAQMPDAFFREAVDFELPEAGSYGVGVCFLPHEPGRAREDRGAARAERPRRGPAGPRLARRADRRGARRRRRPTARARTCASSSSAPRPSASTDQDAFERKLYVIRRIVELAAGPDFYVASFSSRTIVYKGMLIPDQLRGFFPDLQDERFASAMALVHSRFSTNTFPSWELAHPFRVIAHNGEINTLMGNVNWMRARESRARVRALRPRPAEGHADRAPRRLGLGDVRQRPRAAHARRAARCRTR